VYQLSSVGIYRLTEIFVEDIGEIHHGQVLMKFNVNMELASLCLCQAFTYVPDEVGLMCFGWCGPGVLHHDMLGVLPSGRKGGLGKEDLGSFAGERE